MQRWNAAADVPGDLGPSALTIGTFDGVHRGHRELLARVTGTARERDLVPVAITFHPHPLAVLHPERAPAALTSLEHRLELLASTGLGAVLVMTFTRELASWSPERFVAEVMVDALRARAVVVGRDMRFGHRNSGDVDTLRSLGERHGFEVVDWEYLPEVPSSTVIDRLTTDGGIPTWKAYLLAPAVLLVNLIESLRGRSDALLMAARRR